MDAEQEEIRKKEKENEIFSSNALLIIKKMLEWESEHASVLVDEILHSIFFLGKLNDFSPESILRDDEMLNKLKDTYPEAFELYSSQLPKRSPLSCVLDMIVERSGQENEKNIIEALRQIIRQLKKFKLGKEELKPLFSSTICVSHNTSTDIPNSVRYYGVSMSTSGREPGQIMIAASCLSSWDSYVAGAVMTYYPEKSKKSYFDGTIKLPKHVRCQAFNLGQGKELDPCRSCGNLFGLTTNEKQGWAYGHCAEAESLSKLLKNVKEVREQVRPTSETCTEKNRKKAEEKVLIKLRGLLKQVHFVWVNEEFYTPQRV